MTEEEFLAKRHEQLGKIRGNLKEMVDEGIILDFKVTYDEIKDKFEISVMPKVSLEYIQNDIIIGESGDISFN